MKRNNILILSSLALLAFGCSDSEDVVKPTPTPGAEVQFGASLGDSQDTRTVYGDEDKTNKWFPVYWLTDDEVIVSSPTSGMANPTANYKVPSDYNEKDYADELNKTGNIGMRWGDNETADFFSIYPAGNASSSINTKDGTVTFSLSMPAEQTETVETVEKEDGTKYDEAQPNMNACFMYGTAFDVANGTDVDLTFYPYSTAIRFTLSGPSSEANDAVTVNKVVLHAPEDVALAGDFYLTLSKSGDPVVKTCATTYNEVTVYATYSNSAYLTLAYNESVELNAFIIPQDDIQVTNDWWIEVTLADGGVYKKRLGATSTTETSKTTLKAGKIHRLPKLANLDPKKWDPRDWMKNIPRNVYLSEISIPGSWNSLNDDFQDTTDIAKQYAAGVRAFHLDTRWRSNRDGEGITDNNIYNPETSEIGDLSVADGGDTYMMKEVTLLSNKDLGRVMRKESTTFATRLRQITHNVKGNEYMVVLCTWANGSYESLNKDNKNWMQAISDACEDNDSVLDASTLNKNTVVGDVLGKVIVIVCCEDEISKVTLPAKSKCLFTYAPQTLTSTYFDKDYNVDNLYYGSKTFCGVTLYDTYAQVTSNDANTGYDTQTGDDATRRGYAPTVNQRQKQAEAILAWSEDNYKDTEYDHNDWIFLGLGGYKVEKNTHLFKSDTYDAVASSYKGIASTFNT